MARIRTIKPEFWQNEDLADVSEPARLMAIGLLNLADDEGWFKAHPRLIEAAIFPLTEPSLSTHECLIQLSNIGYITLHDGIDGKIYGRVSKFTDHQKINRPTVSKIKGLAVLTEDSLSAHERLTAGKERKGTGKGKEQGKEKTLVPSGDETPPAKPKANADVLEVFEHWKQVMGKSDASKLTKKRKGNIQARIKEGYTVDQIKQSIEGCAATPHNMGQNEQGKRFDDLELICRSGENVERFASNLHQQSAPMAGLSKITQQNLRNLEGEW